MSVNVFVEIEPICKLSMIIIALSSKSRSMSLLPSSLVTENVHGPGDGMLIKPDIRMAILSFSDFAQQNVSARGNGTMRHELGITPSPEKKTPLFALLSVNAIPARS
jgi:hypothetical protein